MSKLLKFAGVLSLLLTLSTPLKAEVEYDVTDLGDFSPTAINNKGDVIGVSRTGTGILYHNGELTVLPSPDGTSTNPMTINDNGIVGGYIFFNTDDYHPFLYSNGSTTDLNNIFGNNSSIKAINNKGLMALYYETPEGGLRSFIYDHGSKTEIGNFGGKNAVVSAINSQGDAVGYSQLPDGTAHAFVFKSGNMTDLGSLGGDTYAEAINDAGQIVGYSVITPGISTHAFLYENGNMIDISGSLEGSGADSINNNGEIVGSGNSGSFMSFLFRKGKMINLVELIEPDWGIRLGAVSINDSGQILCRGWYDSNPSSGRAFLLTPIPEPSTIFLISLVLPILLTYCWRKRILSCLLKKNVQ